MKIFRILTVFISLSIVGLGSYLIAKAATDWSLSYVSVAKIIFGSLLALIGAVPFLAIVTVAVTDKINKHRMKNRGGKQ